MKRLIELGALKFAIWGAVCAVVLGIGTVQAVTFDDGLVHVIDAANLAPGIGWGPASNGIG